MDFYTNGQTRYTNLMNQLNGTNKAELEAFKIGQQLGNIGKNAFNYFSSDTPQEVADGDLGGNTNNADLIADDEKMRELLALAQQGNL